MKKTGKIFLLLISLLIISSGIIFADNDWAEFDYNNSNISFIGTGWYTGGHPETKTGGIKVSLVQSDEYRFNFTGTSIQIYTPSDYDYDSTLIIDGKLVVHSTLKDKYGLTFNVENLTNTEHSLRVINSSTSYNAISPTEIHIGTGEELLPYDESANISKEVLIFESELQEITLYDKIQLDLYMQNIEEIAAEDMLIKYDPEYLSFEGISEIDNMKLVYSKVDEGTIRVVIASKGAENIVNTKTLLSNIKFKGIKVGETTVSYQKAKVTDGITYEKDLTPEQLGNIKIIIKEPVFLDVNKNGEYTLLDLGIIARNLGAILPNEDYILDQHIDNKVDDLDLIAVYDEILANPLYVLN